MFETTRREESIRPQGPEISIDMEVANWVSWHSSHIKIAEFWCMFIHPSMAE